MEGVGYRGGEVLLERGDCLFLYTDGVVEAQNERGEFFGEDRMRIVLEGGNGMSAESLTRAVLESLSAFTEGAEQSDDITMLALRYLGPSGEG
jgi:serine phosphatase RsbU (regulator of sigma subunit)